jgi:hypothetical protein
MDTGQELWNGRFYTQGVTETGYEFHTPKQEEKPYQHMFGNNLRIIVEREPL